MATGRVLGRYELLERIATGGMATVYLGRLKGPVGFSRIVAIKELHPQFAADPLFVGMLVDEAQLTASVRHRNVVAATDVVVEDGIVWVVMDYVAGESLSRLARGDDAGLVPTSILVAIVFDLLSGLHAAHEARGAEGQPLGIVHRDVSPHNVLVGVDGTARVIDFGVAKAEGRRQTTGEGAVKGKVAYMAPEQLRGERVTRQADIFSSGVVLWELLTGERLFQGETQAQAMANVLQAELAPPSRRVGERGAPFDALTMRALARDPAERYATAEAMANDLLACAARATEAEVGRWVEQNASDEARTHWRRSSEMASASASVSATELASHIDTRPFTNEPTLPVVIGAPAVAPKPRRLRFIVAGTLGFVALGGVAAGWMTTRHPASGATDMPTTAAAPSAAPSLSSAPPSEPSATTTPMASSATAVAAPAATSPASPKPTARPTPHPHRSASGGSSGALDPTRYP